MRFWIGALTATLIVAPQTITVTEYEVIVREVEREWVEREWVETPIADSLVDWDEVDRQTDCLWIFLQDHFGYDLTLDRVMAAGYWTDELGGACAVIGEDDE